jgi:hypothetical protein
VLTGRVIASHYAEPLARAISSATELWDGPDKASQVIGHLEPGAPFAMLDDSLGWAWGYAGEDMRVGYVPSSVLKAS